MNTATLSNGFDTMELPARAESPFLKPFPDMEEVNENIHVFRILDRAHSSPPPAPLPEKRHQVLDVDSMVVSASLLRRIESELKNDTCDLRTVFTSCRGLKRGSLEFEDAYIKARIKSFTRHLRMASDPQLDIPFQTRSSALNSRLNTVRGATVTLPNPMAVNHPGHLMSHLGIWVMALLGIQFWASWRIGAFANTYLEGGRMFYFAIAVFLYMTINSVVWFRKRGNLCDAFLIPGVVMFLMALTPIFLLHLRVILLATR